jgi:hypothetical protein
VEQHIERESRDRPAGGGSRVAKRGGSVQDGQDALRDLIAGVIVDCFASAPGDLAIPCHDGKAVADIILARAQERGLIPYCPTP